MVTHSPHQPHATGAGIVRIREACNRPLFGGLDPIHSSGAEEVGAVFSSLKGLCGCAAWP